MIRKILLACSLMATSYCFGGSCANHIKINSIANIQLDGGDILVRADSFVKGQNFNWPSIPTNSTFRIATAQDAEFKKNSLAALLTAKTTRTVVYFQISYLSTYAYQIDKVSLGESTSGLDCAIYQ